MHTILQALNKRHSYNELKDWRTFFSRMTENGYTHRIRRGKVYVLFHLMSIIFIQIENRKINKMDEQ